MGKSIPMEIQQNNGTESKWGWGYHLEAMEVLFES